MIFSLQSPVSSRDLSGSVNSSVIPAQAGIHINDVRT